MLTKEEVEYTFEELDELHEAQSLVLKRVISSMDECIASLDRLINTLNGECTWGCICKECGAKFEHKCAAFFNYCPACGARVVRDA